MQGDGKILGEKENVTAGIDGNFALRLDAGSYGMYCPGAAKDAWTFTVSGAAPMAAADTSLTDATTKYRDHVIAEVDTLTTTTRAFTDAVRAGDIAKARTQFAPDRASSTSRTSPRRPPAGCR